MEKECDSNMMEIEPSALLASAQMRISEWTMFVGE